MEIGVSTILILIVSAIMIAMAAVVLISFRTTRKLVDRTRALDSVLKAMEESAAQSLASTAPDLQKDVSVAIRPKEMDDSQLMDWIDARIEESKLYLQADVNLKIIAEKLGIPQRRILQALKSRPEYGTLPEYLTVKRLETACQLLKHKPFYTIESISKDSGFGARRTFQTVFKARMGMTPSDYRSAAFPNETIH